jgi:nitroimidazol reductase NimA-like FMN-containing flavoprotein (pyridoxamine 5'-phosphate oxidase superfamily)
MASAVTADEGEQAGAGAWRTGPRATVRRKSERGRYDRETIDAVLDEAFVCHVGFCTDQGPVVVPTAYARVDDVVYLHGAPANHALRTIGNGAPVSVAVTLVDGLVLARSGFHHSINYRSVVLYGHAHEVTDEAEKRRALDAVVEQIVPGRTADARGPSESELRATRVVRVTVDEASAKVRSGGPIDDPEDVEAGGIWAGHIPLALAAGSPVPDDSERVPLPVPEYARHYRRPRRA